MVYKCSGSDPLSDQSERRAGEIEAVGILIAVVIVVMATSKLQQGQSV